MRSAIASSSRAVFASVSVVPRPAARALSTSVRAAAALAPTAPVSFSSVRLARGVDLGRAGMPRLAVGHQQARTMFIQTETTPNEASLKFIPGTTVMENGTAEFLDMRSALGSPLASRLLNIDGIVGVFYGPDFVTCSKDESYSWSILKPEVFAVLMEHFSSGAPLFKEGHGEGPDDTRVLDSDSEVVGMIKELLETRVRPAIQEDGGDIEYKGFDEATGTVMLMLKGSCRGCSSSEVTLKNGIERMLMHYVPEVERVEQFLEEEQKIALDEFNKLEAKLAKKKDGDDGKADMSQYMSA